MAEKIAVVLFQLGGPDSLEAIEPFLYNLFCDPDIIDLPGAFLYRKRLAKLISSRRSKKVIENYRAIGGKSPITDLTIIQARALESKLNKNIQASVFVAMRYWHPLIEETLVELQKEKFNKIILLPLYPQYSKATTGSSLNEWYRQCALRKYTPISIESVQSFHRHSFYINALVDNIQKTLVKFPRITPEKIDIVFSAHGTPISLVKQGDPYKEQIEETVRLVMNEGRWQSPHVLCYQSKVGPVKWLRPSLQETICDLAIKGKKHVLIVPISFVTEHIETLHEINIEMRAEAVRLGIIQFEIMPALNDHPMFIQCLSDLVMEKV